MKTIITHINPHLDEAACMWMLRRFLPGWSNAQLKFIKTTPTGGGVKDPDKDKNTIYLGVGRGRFDEHKGGDLEDSATTLIYKFLVREKKIALTPVEKSALAELVAYVNDEDHGRLIKAPHREFSAAAVVSLLTSRVGRSSREAIEFGELYFDAVFAGLIEKHALLRDMKRARYFETPWGTGVSVSTTGSPKVVLRLAAEQGAVLAVVVNPKNKFRSIRALAESTVNLETAYSVVHAKEPRAEWFLHQSKKMLICGSDVALNKQLSRIPLATLTALVTR